MQYCLSFNHVHKIVERSAREIQDTGFEPDYILAIGSGGFIPARILRTFIDKPIICVTVASYDDAARSSTGELKKIQWIDGVDISGKKILLVDDIDDTRATLEFCLKELLNLNPSEIAVFVLHHKKKAKKGAIPSEVKKMFVGEHLDDVWIYYPWEANNIDEFEKLLK